ADARPERHRARRLRGDRSEPHGEARGEVGSLGARGAAGRVDVAVSLVAPPAPRLHRPPPGARRRPDGDHRRPGVPPAPLVAALPAQSDGAAREGCAPLPEEHRRRRRSVPAQALTEFDSLSQITPGDSPRPSAAFSPLSSPKVAALMPKLLKK